MGNGYIYIMTNPCLQGMVKIGYATDVEKRRKELSGTSVPLDFEIYATYEVPERLTDKTLHTMIKTLNPELQVEDDKKKKKKEFFYIQPDDAYSILYAIAKISGTSKRLIKKVSVSEQKKVDNAKKQEFKFSLIGLKKGDVLTFYHYDDIKCKIIDDKRVEFNGKNYSLSSLGLKLLKEKERKKWKSIQGPAYFYYKGKSLSMIRAENGV